MSKVGPYGVDLDILGWFSARLLKAVCDIHTVIDIDELFVDEGSNSSRVV